MPKLVTCIVWVVMCCCLQGCRQATVYNAAGEAVAPAGAAAITVPALSAPDYVGWCRDKENGLQKSKEIEELTYSLQYKPASYVACLENQNNTMTADTLAKKISELNGLDYFDFKIEITSGAGELLKHNVSSVTEYDQRVNYFAFDMQKDIKLIRGKDTLECELFHFERAYDVAPYAVVLLGFPKVSASTEPVEFFYQDKVFHKGIIKFTYSPETFNHIPKLKTI